jgi:hypothetical protein
MNYQPYLIANFATGIDRAKQPWLSPDDSQQELFDGYIYRGVWHKRQGYSQFATGQKGGTSYTESRMVHSTISGMIGAIDGVNQVFTAGLSPVVSRGSVTVTGSNPVQSFTDDGLGNFYDGITLIGTVDYSNGNVSITLPVAPILLSTVTIENDTFNDLPVMGIMNYFTQIDSRELITADIRYVNRYNPTTNRLEDISPSTLLTGNETNFMSYTNYPDPQDNQRLLFVNYADPIHQYSGSTVSVYPLYTDSVDVPSTASGVVGDGTAGPYTINTPAGTGILPGSLSITDPTTPQTVTDDQFGNLTGDGTGTVNYLTGEIIVTFTLPVGPGNAINISYKQLNTPIDTCRHIRFMKDRGVALSTVESGVRKGLRIRISGTGAFGDVWTVDAIGAGFIDIPDQTFIQACDFNRDELIIFTETSVWSMKYTGSDIVPFSLDKLDGTRGSQAPYGTITYLNRTSAASTRGFIMTDGYSIIRTDDRIPEFSYNDIQPSRFGLCFAGAVDDDRDHYLIHPSPGNLISNRILVTNYEEDNFAVYRIPLSCMGNFIETQSVTWNDLTIYDNWDELDDDYGSWNEFSYSVGAPFALGGGHEGQIFKLNYTQLEDYTVKVRDATVIDATTVRIETDFQNYENGDIVCFERLGGMLQLNDKQAAIKRIVTPNYEFDIEIITEGYDAYTSGGQCSKVIKFSSKTKKFNPFAEQNLKVRCGWVYFYVSTTGTNLTINKNILNASQTSPCVLSVFNHGYTTGTQVYVDAVQGMTELNGRYYYITVIDDNSFSLDGIDATGYAAYTSGGFTSIPEDAKLQVYVITNDTNEQLRWIHTTQRATRLT